MKHSEASVLTPTGFTLSSGPFVPDRTHISLSLLCFINLFLSLSVSLALFFVPLSDFRRVRGGNGCKIGDESGSL